MKGEPKWNWTMVFFLTSLTPYCWARLAHSGVLTGVPCTVSTKLGKPIYLAGVSTIHPLTLNQYTQQQCMYFPKVATNSWTNFLQSETDWDTGQIYLCASAAYRARMQRNISLTFEHFPWGRCWGLWGRWWQSHSTVLWTCSATPGSEPRWLPSGESSPAERTGCWGWSPESARCWLPRCTWPREKGMIIMWELHCLLKSLKICSFTTWKSKSQQKFWAQM